jgi:hypothetical protein
MPTTDDTAPAQLRYGESYPGLPPLKEHQVSYFFFAQLGRTLKLKRYSLKVAPPAPPCLEGNRQLSEPAQGL